MSKAPESIDSWDLTNFLTKFQKYLVGQENEISGCRTLFIQDIAESKNCENSFEEIFVTCLNRNLQGNASESVKIKDWYNAEKEFFCFNNNVNKAGEWGIYDKDNSDRLVDLLINNHNSQYGYYSLYQIMA
jgi:hypothetical protein